MPAERPKAELILDFLIVGGGMAGLSCAIALAQGGHNVQVFEQSDGNFRSDEVIRSPPYTTRILQQWGLDHDALISHSETMRRSRFNDGNTNELLQILGWADPTRELGADYHLIQHGQLHTFLLDLAQSAGAKIRFSAHVEQVDPQSPSILLSSGETVSGDIVVGADGWDSAVRSVVSSGAPRPAAEQGMAYSALIPADKVNNDLELAELLEADTLNVYMSDNSILTGFYLTQASERKYFLIVQNLSVKPITMQEQWGGSFPLHSKNLHLDLDPFLPSLRRLIGLADTVTAVPYLTMRPLESWVHDGNKVVLVGNAGQPSPPHSMHGPAAAIEDGMALGTLFSRLSTSNHIPILLSVYDEMRRQRAVGLNEDECASTHLLSLPKGPEYEDRNARMRTAYASVQSVQSRWDELDDGEGMRQLWDDYFRIAKEDAHEAALDWWSKWGAVLNQPRK